MVVYNFVPGNFGNCSLVLSSTSSLLPSSTPLRRRCAAPPSPWRAIPAPPPACAASTCRLEAPHRHPSCSAALLHARHAAQNPPPAATATPPWLARCRTPELYLARAPEPVALPYSFPLTHLPFSAPRSPRTPPPPAIATGALSSPWTHCSSTTPPLPTSQLALPCSHEAHQPFLPANPSPERRLR